MFAEKQRLVADLEAYGSGNAPPAGMLLSYGVELVYDSVFKSVRLNLLTCVGEQCI